MSGWGVYGLNLTLELIKQDRNPVWVSPPHLLEVDNATTAALKPVQQRQQHLADLLEKTGLLEFDFPALHSLRNDFLPALEDQIIHGSRNIGIIFFENTDFSDAGLARARKYDLIVTGSTWNKERLEACGLTHVVNVFQGIDNTLFRADNEATRYPGRFVIFSGGKLEYRKAQDVVIAAFREFQKTHKEALLLCAWANQWPRIMPTISRSPYVVGSPAVQGDRSLDLSPWLLANGLPKGSFVDLGMPPNKEIPGFLASSDTAIFPNRCEPGTNLVAMEAMAAGLPVILSANTGHLDLIEEGNSFVLLRQTPVAPYAPYTGVEGWAEPDVKEVLAHLTKIYADRKTAIARGKAAANTLKRFAWSGQIARLLSHVDKLNE
ncbi:MAG: glycosyltransferase family 4 protein [Rhodospirillales bacterium]|nr:glycosyltransferase family 4 protein [Rhodospirillales bacterium]